MKMIKFALLGTAALAAVTVSARASELSDLKAQIEALNARFDAQSAIPAGYQLLQVGRADAIVIPSLDVDANGVKKHLTFSVVPAADMPASTVIQWSGNVKAALTYRNIDEPFSTDTTYSDVRASYGLKVVGTTETAVGEVGAKIAFTGGTEGIGQLNTSTNNKAYVKTDGYWGWWKITPELTLGGGRDGSLSGNGEGFDGRATAHFANVDGNGGYKTIGDVAQMRLSYASGPLAAAIALEDSTNSYPTTSRFGVAGDLKYSGDSFGVELNAGIQNRDAPADIWTVNAGAHYALGDMGLISAAAGMGSGTNAAGVGGDDYTKASVFAKLNLSESARAELGASHRWQTEVAGTAGDRTSFGVGLYYAPVSQLTIGLEADYSTVEAGNKTTNAALVTVFSF